MRAILLPFVAVSLLAQTPRFGAKIPVQPEILGNPTPLTSEGSSRRAHWATNGKQLLVVHSESGKCPQAYWMDPVTKEKVLATPDAGSVRSAAALVKNKTWVYEASPAGASCATTNLGDVPEQFDIYFHGAKGKQQKIASAVGYEGEMDVSNEEKRIAYTSQASGDLEIWTMDFDGLNKKQLTRSPGYDGDPSFSRDGKRIVFRSHRAKTNEAQRKVKEELAAGRAPYDPSEIYVMASNGTDEKQITSYGCIVANPVFAPDGRRIVFASNLPGCNTKKFELFMVNLDGTGLVQITKDSKTGATEPSFSPNGKSLAFTRDGNILIADWLAPAPPPDSLTPLSKP